MTQNSSASLRASPGLSPDDDLTSLRKALIEEQDRLIAAYRHDLATAQAIQVQGGEDVEDLASIETDQNLLFAHSEQERKMLRLVEEALRRMDDGTYGICLMTGEPIPLDRLRQVPWARYVESVQERIERGEPAESPRMTRAR